MFTGDIQVRGDVSEALNKIHVAMTTDGFDVERVGQTLIVKLSDLKDFLFQTQVGKIYWSKLVLQPDEGRIRYAFVYRTQIQLFFHMIVTMFFFVTLKEQYPPSGLNLWALLLVLNGIGAAITLVSAQHSKTKILQKIRTGI